MNERRESEQPEWTLIAGYEGGPEMPLGGYAILLGGYLVLFGTGFFIARRNLPEQVSSRDLLLMGIATHKLARIATRDWVTSPLRAPFTRYMKALDSGEVAETSRGKRLQRAVGDLLTCPWCIGPWIAGFLSAGWIGAPRMTRLVAGTFTAVTLSDFLHQTYDLLRKRARA